MIGPSHGVRLGRQGLSTAGSLNPAPCQNQGSIEVDHRQDIAGDTHFWQLGHQWVLRPANRSRIRVVPQRRQGIPPRR